VPQPVPSAPAVLARSADGRTLGRVTVPVPSGADAGEAAISLPPELRNRLDRLVLDGAPTTAGIVLLDERWRRRPVGLVAGDMAAADAPLTGPLFYLRRALGPYAELRVGEPETLLKRDLSVIVMADRVVPPGAERDALLQWVQKGGLLIRFAGPRLAAQGLEVRRNDGADPLLPVRLLAGDRQLGGALSWSQPAGLAPFAATSPFAGLDVPEEARVTRQVLAEPSATLAGQTWAALTDGTPLVTEAARGNGRVVLFHVTANADWSDLPLSGLFVDMLRRLVALSVGVAGATEDNATLAPAETLDGFGLFTRPPPAARGLAADAFGRTPVSPEHPPGLYGAENARQALNLSATLRAPEQLPATGGTTQPLAGTPPERALGPSLLALAILLLAADLIIGLALRGLLWRRSPARGIGTAGAVALLLAITPALAQAPGQETMPAVATRLGYIVSGDSQVDGVARAGLAGLSAYVNQRTAANLSPPDGVVPGKDDLSFYPLLYWPITADAPALEPAAQAALNSYMSNGGIILIDTRGSGSGEGFAPGTEAALQRLAAGLTVPALAPLDNDHVLTRSFYLLQEFPGRFTGGPVWVQREQDRANDSVSPVIIGGNDWAAAWATDTQGRNPYAAIPGGARQRLLAYRFGVNLVIYALTGNYKGDQVHVPAILERLGH